jgi:hypothetical protein
MPPSCALSLSHVRGVHGCSTLAISILAPQKQREHSFDRPAATVYNQVVQKQESHQMPFSIHADTWQARKAKAILLALIEMAKDKETPYDFFISKMIWAVSLYLESGDYKENWKTRLRASDAAIKLRKESKDWKSLVTFEHARTLFDTFGLLRRNDGTAIGLDEAADIIAEYPPVLITKEENDEITKRGFKKSGAPEDRYKHIVISTFELRAI